MNIDEVENISLLLSGIYIYIYIYIGNLFFFISFFLFDWNNIMIIIKQSFKFIQFDTNFYRWIEKRFLKTV